MIYLDCAATTKPCPEAVAAVSSALTDVWGNPSSAHAAGNDARRRVDSARAVILKTLGFRRGGSLIFTASGTEANNAAVLGVCRSKARRGRIIISDGEHASVYASTKQAEAEGFELVTVPTKNGALDIEVLRESLTRDTVLLSLMLVNSETGALYDIGEAFRIAKEISPDCILHTDATQGYMKTRFPLSSLGADLITVSGHKIHAPKGVGALFVGDRVTRMRAISPVVYGGGQESGLRSGTVNVPAIMGFAAAAERASATAADDIAHMEALRESIIDRVLSSCPGVRPNIPATSAPHIISLTLPGIKSETMLNYLSSRGICVSSGSACSTHSRSISRALLAFGLTEREADTTIRVSVCRDTTGDETDAFISALSDGVRSLARMK